MDAEGALPKRSVDKFDHRFSNRGRVGIWRNDGSETLHHVFSKSLVGTRLVLGDTLFIGWSSRMGKVVCASRKGARNHNGSLDTPASEFAGINNGHRIHTRLGREVRSEVRRRTASAAAAGDPDDQAMLLPAQLRECGPIYPLRTQDVDVVEFGQLFRSKGFGGTENHVASVVNHNIQSALAGHDPPNCCIDGFFRRYIQLDRS